MSGPPSGGPSSAMAWGVEPPGPPWLHRIIAIRTLTPCRAITLSSKHRLTTCRDLKLEMPTASRSTPEQERTRWGVGKNSPTFNWIRHRSSTHSCRDPRREHRATAIGLIGQIKIALSFPEPGPPPLADRQDRTAGGLGGPKPAKGWGLEIGERCDRGQMRHSPLGVV